MRRARLWVTGIAVLLVAGGSSAAQRIMATNNAVGRADQSVGATPVVPGPSPAPGVTPQRYGTGIAAIQPHGPTDPLTPAFTEEDVREYFKTHEPLQAASDQPAPVVSKVQFVTTEEAIKIIDNDALQQPPGALLCVVTLTGHFLVDSPPDLPRPTGSVAFDIFDAHTGNFIAEAGPGR